MLKGRILVITGPKEVILQKIPEISGGLGATVTLTFLSVAY